LLSDYLATAEGRSSSEANGLVHQASRIGADPDVRDAALAGTVSPGKAAAIGRVLRDLPRAEMTPEQNRAAADTLIGQAAGGATTRQIAGSTDKVLEQVAPNLAPTPEGRAAEAERQRRQAIRGTPPHLHRHRNRVSPHPRAGAPDGRRPAAQRGRRLRGTRPG
jgi:hypothetical protein